MKDSIYMKDRKERFMGQERTGEGWRRLTGNMEKKCRN